MEYKPHAYQTHATEHILDNSAAGLFLDMGLGKTVSTLTAINELLFNTFEAGRVLVIAPKRVAQSTWSKEIEKWDHLAHLKIAKVLGSETERKKALQAKADIYVINRENVPWIVALYGTKWPFDTLVIDELSSFKSPKSARFKALKKIRPLVKRVIGLTGTPSPNGLHDLWAQVYLLDQGERLGKTVGGYREQYLKPDKMMGEIVTKYKAKEGASALIQNKISDICISMKAADYLDLPELININIEVPLSNTVIENYLKFEEEQVIQILAGEDITAVNAGALTNKLLQFANGAVYNVEKIFRVVHDEKLDALEELVEAANGAPVLIFYSYRHDLERITERLKSYKPKELKSEAELDAWNSGEILVLLAHPASAGHGLNMQDGGNILIWFGLPWSLELYMQAVARLHRQGQKNVVRNYAIVAPGTVDTDVMAALSAKAQTQDELLEALKARINKIKTRINAAN